MYDIILCHSNGKDELNGVEYIGKMLTNLNYKVKVHKSGSVFNSLYGEKACYMFFGPQALKNATAGRTPSLKEARRGVHSNGMRQQKWSATYKASLAVTSDQWANILVNDCTWLLWARDGQEVPVFKGTICPDGWIGWDIETDGVFYGKHGRILSVAMSDGEGVIGAALDDVSQLNPDYRVLCGHGIKYDIQWWEEKVGPVDFDIFCTEIAEGLINDNVTDNSLAFLTSRYTSIPYFKDMVDRANLAKEDIKTVLLYNKYDALASVQVAKQQWNTILENGQANIFKFMMDMTKVFADVERTGIYIDQKWAYDRGWEVQALKAEALLKIGLTEDQMRSSKELGRRLFHELKLPQVAFTPTGKPKLDKEALETMLERTGDEVVQAILDFRKYDKLFGTYYRPVPEWIEHDGRVHSSYNLASGEFGGTKTGRSSSRNPNLQNIPKSVEDRGMFAATPGWRWCDADYSQLELRVVADLSGDSTMLDIFKQGRDIHTSTMVGFSNLSYEAIKEGLAQGDKTLGLLRRCAKCVNFGILYGVGPTTLKKLAKDAGADIDISTARQRIDQWRGQYPGVADWMWKIEEEVIKNGYVQMVTGRRRTLPDADRTTPEGQRALRQATNAPVQGTASDITMTAMYLLHLFFKRHGGARLLLNVHDQIGLEFDPNVYTDETIKEIVHDVMVNQVPTEFNSRFNYQFTVPLEIDMSVGERWS